MPVPPKGFKGWRTSREQKFDIITFILSSCRFPAGDKAFDVQAMSGTMFRAYRPQ